MLNFTLPDDFLTIPDLPKLDAACELNPNIEEFNSIKNKAKDAIASLISGGIAESLSSLTSTLESNLSNIEKSFNENLLSDIPKIGLKLQDEFHSVMNFFSGGDKSAALSKLQEIQNQFPDFDIQKALDGAAGILPAGAIPPNAVELIKGNLSEMVSNLEIALPKIEKLGGDISSGVTSFLGSAQTAIGSALSSITSGSGTTGGLTSLASQAQTAVSGAVGELSKLGGAFSAKDGPMSELMTSLGDTASSLSGNLTKGIAKILEFDICTAIPNMQVVDGEVEDLPIPPIKPTEDSEPAESPTPAPTPAVPVLDDRFTFPFWTENLKNEIQHLISPKVDGKQSAISNKIPLDTNWPQLYKKEITIIESAAKDAFSMIENISSEVAMQFDKDLGQFKKDIIATQKHILDVNRNLHNMNENYLYRVKNNLIDKLE